MKIDIIYENDDYIIINKPFGIPSQPDKTGDTDLLSILTDYTNNSNVGLIHRLDRPVGGLILYSKNKAANSFLSAQIRNNTIHKEYLAVVCGSPAIKSGTLINYLIKDSRNNVSTVTDETNSKAKKAVLDYASLQTVSDLNTGELSLLKINLHTGRHHQIRAQLSHLGNPIFGDVKYGNQKATALIPKNIALFSYSLEFISPSTKKISRYTCVPRELYPFKLFYSLDSIN